jgi:AAA domain
LAAVEADWKRLYFPPDDDGELDLTSDGDLRRLRGWVEGNGIGVVVFDALLDHLGVGNEFKPKQVRHALRPLRRLAADLGTAVVGSLHPRKGKAVSFRVLIAGSHQFNA